jgi:hypothetical protein
MTEHDGALRNVLSSETGNSRKRWPWSAAPLLGLHPKPF